MKGRAQGMAPSNFSYVSLFWPLPAIVARTYHRVSATGSATRIGTALKLWHGILIACALFFAAKWIRPRIEQAIARYRVRRPDSPVAFEPRLPWLAIRTRNTQAVASLLGLGDAMPANWRLGIAQTRNERGTQIFVSPPVLGWTLVVGFSLPSPVGRRFVDKCSPLLEQLGREFADVQYFQGDSLIELFAWARVVDGKIVRAFAIGDEGMIWNKGKLTKEERTLGLKMFELRGVQGGSAVTAAGDLFAYPTDEHVLKLASRWSLDPTKLAMVDTITTTGLLGRAPAAWRSERAGG